MPAATSTKTLADAPAQTTDAAVLDAVRAYWGFDGLRPMQARAIEAGLDARDSLVVLPTGGGKSLCYQVPPLVAGRTDVVVSPLISLMKDQVDALEAIGYPAAALHSDLSPEERRAIEGRLEAGELRLLFVAPERVLLPAFLARLERAGVRVFAIDEAHCISQWGHDFRPEYRQLARLKERFPEASFHAFTATATPRVQEDIVRELGLRDPAVLVGRFDRPNLVYRVVPRIDLRRQVMEVLSRHTGEAAIVYCVSRKETERLAAYLEGQGVSATHYHAGMESAARRRAQERFTREEIDVVVATVAFGMGIDRSNVRCVMHAAMPKSVEAYQQETGRAGRDGLEAECVLFYSPADTQKWEALVRKGAEEAGADATVVEAHLELLGHMRKFCEAPVCRHAALSAYFGQTLESGDCGACDACLGEVEGLEEATETAQKILSCIARVEQRFGVGHVADVLVGADTQNVRRLGHENLSTYGLLSDLDKKSVMNLVYQIVDQGLAVRGGGDRPILVLNEASWEVLRGNREVRLRPPRARKAVKRSRAESESWEGVDQTLFERLRELRRTLAKARGVPPYVIFHDSVLRELARAQPQSANELRQLKGIGEKKLADYGEAFLEVIRDAS
jgi:ATP-dependent DNA helicase RecQ